MKTFQQYIEVMRDPHNFIKDSISRFEDYIGNALFGFENWLYYSIEHPDVGNEINKSHKEIFDRIRRFIELGFEEQGNLTINNLNKFIEMEKLLPNRDTLEKLKIYFRWLKN